MNDKPMKEILEKIARRNIPDDTNLMPRIAADLERKSLMMTLRTRPLAAIFLALFLLAILIWMEIIAIRLNSTRTN